MRGAGLVEGKDFFLIKDNCLTELESEEIGDDGIGRTLTCIGFRPLQDEIAHAISRKFQHSHYYYEAAAGDERFYGEKNRSSQGHQNLGIRGIYGKTGAQSISMLSDMASRIENR